MKKIVIIIAAILIIWWIFFIGIVLFEINRVGKDLKKMKEGISYIFKGLRKGFIQKNLFFQDINLSDSSYALYIKHREFGEFMVLDQRGLIKNQDSLEISVSWLNYWPGEGDRSFGVMLFKDQRLVKSKLGGIFKTFEIGNLVNYALPVKKQSFDGVKKEIQSKLETLKNKENIFVYNQPNLSAYNKEFYFQIYFPSISIPVTREIDTMGNERIKTVAGIDYEKWKNEEEIVFRKKWSRKIENFIHQKAGTARDFDIFIGYGNLKTPFLFDATQSWGEELKSASNNLLTLKEFILYDFYAHISASKNEAERLLKLDYSDCLSDEERNRPALIAKLKELTKQSTKPYLSVDKGEVGLSEYQDVVTKYEKICEKSYSLFWLEVENTP